MQGRYCARWLTGFAIAAAAAVCLVPIHAQTSDEATDLIVHEWGTFLAMQGSDGVALEGMYHEEHALPDFVHSRGRDQLHISSARMKGETPVVYFYTKNRQNVSLHVGFPDGIWTQWYPQASYAAPGLVIARSL